MVEFIFSTKYIAKTRNAIFRLKARDNYEQDCALIHRHTETSRSVKSHQQESASQGGTKGILKT